ncbi:hypothetical protein [Pseudarthrobacter sp. H2]|uniref:hypothetical protein n=1 Tax=Pseudarthrobacter sp. H2 TaxID=3418415 RepID=UPI003CE8F5A7
MQKPSHTAPQDLDHAVRLFKRYIEGNSNFDELDFKEYLVDVLIEQEASLREQAVRLNEVKHRADDALERMWRLDREYAAVYVKEQSEIYVTKRQAIKEGEKSR